jgi:hypothetical protein
VEISPAKSSLFPAINKTHKNSKKYIDSHQEIDLKHVLTEYQVLIKDFYDWFYKKVEKLYVNELEEFAEVEKELAILAP